MWRHEETNESVRCIACDVVSPREDMREYDRYGNRWDRAGKTFEYLCKPCHTVESHQPRRGLEDLLGSIGQQPSTNAFIAAYYRRVAADREEPPGA